MFSRPSLGVLWTAAALTSLCLAPLAASAQDAEQYSREGYYASASAMYAQEQFRDTDSIDVEDALGFSFALGMRLNSLVAIEWENEVPIQGFAVDPLPGAVNRPGKNVRTDDIVTWTSMFNAKVYLPFGRVEPFLHYGIGMMYANPSPAAQSGTGSLNRRGPRVDFAFQAGGGMDLYLTTSLALTFDANYVLPTDQLQPLSHWSYSAGIKYRFGALTAEDEE